MLTTRSRLARATAALGVLLLGGWASAAPAPPARPAATALLSPDQSIPPVALEALVDATVRQAMERDHIAGVTVAVVQDGKVVLKKGYGFADVALQRPVDPGRTLFRVGSITKTFTWLMTLNAVERGRMSLDAPLNTYLPPGLRIPGRPGWRQVEVRDAIAHTPGFEDLPLKHLFLRDPARLLSVDDDLAAHRPARVYPPGEVGAYQLWRGAGRRRPGPCRRRTLAGCAGGRDPDARRPGPHHRTRDLSAARRRRIGQSREESVAGACQSRASPSSRA
jgi:CubicO group peptidase (beta-lactamase class C family)